VRRPLRRRGDRRPPGWAAIDRAAQRSFAGFLFTRGRFDEARALYQDALAQLPAQEPSARQLNG
jgi:hypothetical protein